MRLPFCKHAQIFLFFKSYIIHIIKGSVTESRFQSLGHQTEFNHGSIHLGISGRYKIYEQLMFSFNLYSLFEYIFKPFFFLLQFSTKQTKLAKTLYKRKAISLK